MYNYCDADGEKMDKAIEFLNKDREKFKIAIDIFASKGYHSTTMDEVAQSMGIAKGTIYYHFKNKEELYFSTIKLGMHILENMVREATAACSGVEEKIEAVISGQLIFINEYSDIAYIFLRELNGNNLLRDFSQDALNSYKKIIQGILAEGQSTAVFKKDLDAETAAVAMFGMIATVALHHHRQGKSMSMDETKRNLIKMIFEGLLEK